MYFTILSLLSFLKLLFPVLHMSGYNSFPKPLSKKEEKNCLKAIKQGDVSARNKLIEHNLRLVVHIIKKYYSAQKDQDDLISIGTIGLIKAVSSFDYKKGTKFATYASRCIENEILMYFRSLKKTSQDISMQTPVDNDKDGNELTLMDIMADKSSIFDEIDLCMKAQQLNECIDKCLTEREKTIVKMRYGLGKKGDLTQREVASKLKISRSYVSRIEKKALEKLKEEFGNENL